MPAGDWAETEPTGGLAVQFTRKRKPSCYQGEIEIKFTTDSDINQGSPTLR